MKTLIFKLLLLVALLYVWACDKAPIINADPTPVMPPFTTTGAKTFGCYVNGKLWVAKTCKPFTLGCLPPVVLYYYYDSTDEFNLTGTIYNDSIYQTLYICSIIPQVGKYPIKYLPLNENFYNSSIPNVNQCGGFLIDTTKTNFLDVTFLDEEKHIVSGRFELTVFNKCKDTLHITDGQFDVKY